MYHCWLPAFSLAPFLLFVSSAFKTQTQVTAIPPRVVAGFFLEFFHSAIVRYGILRYLLNSTIVAGSATLVTISLATLAGYALARLPRRWAQMILMGILACAMFPQIAIAGPIWRFLRYGMAQHLPGIVLPYVALTLPLAVWILALFFREMPEELEAAALVDGCSRLGALIRVIVPLSAPGLFTAAILTFIYAWNEFFLALLIVTDPAKQTMPVGIALFQGEHTVPWGEIAAASFITTAPWFSWCCFSNGVLSPVCLPVQSKDKRMASLRLKGISKRFGDVVAFSDVDLYVEEGNFACCWALQGAGRAHCCKSWRALHRRTGFCLVDGQPVDHLIREIRDVAMVFQSYALYPHMTVAQNLGFGLRMRGITKNA